MDNKQKIPRGKSEVINFINRIFSKSKILEEDKIIPNCEKETILDFFCIKSSKHNWYTYGIPKRIVNCEKLLNLIIEKNKRILSLEKQLNDFLKGK